MTIRSLTRMDMREVAVIGIGQTKIDEHWDKSLRYLAGDAALSPEDSGWRRWMQSMLAI
jgi:acetyl-CoA C-acetyltransferase